MTLQHKTKNTHIIWLIIFPRRNNAFLDLVLEGNHHGKELFEIRYSPPLHSLIDKQRIRIVIQANTNIDEDHLVSLERGGNLGVS